MEALLKSITATIMEILNISAVEAERIILCRAAQEIGKPAGFSLTKESMLKIVHAVMSERNCSKADAILLLLYMGAMAYTVDFNNQIDNISKELNITGAVLNG